MSRLLLGEGNAESNSSVGRGWRGVIKGRVFLVYFLEVGYVGVPSEGRRGVGKLGGIGVGGGIESNLSSSLSISPSSFHLSPTWLVNYSVDPG